jgi:cephalosporin-C deacetylase-like acetyl esterase
VPRFDLTLPELETYRPDVLEPSDFDAFWTETLDEARSAGGEVAVTAVESPASATRFPWSGDRSESRSRSSAVWELPPRG